MSFGFSPGDIVMFGKFLVQVSAALKEDDGSRVQYLRATKQCKDFDAVLASIRSLDLSNAPESFKEQLAQCAFDTKCVINDFRNTVSRYEKSMGENSKRGKLASAPRKIQWAFDAADDLDDFRKRLQSQLHRIQITLQGNVWEMLSRLDQRTQFLDESTSLILATRGLGVPMGRKTWIAGSTAVPLILEPMYQKVDFIGNLLFERLFNSESGPPILEMGRAFTIQDDATGAVGMSEMSLKPRLSGNESKQIPGPIWRGAHTSSAPKAPIPPTQPHGKSNGICLSEEVNELLRSLNLGELSPNEERQLHTSSAPQSALEPPPDTDRSASVAQPIAFGDESLPTGKKGSPSDRTAGKPHRFAVPTFQNSGLDLLSTVASVSIVVDFVAGLATQFRGLRDGDRELMRLASMLSRASEVLQLIVSLTEMRMSGRQSGLTSSQTFILELSKEIEHEARAAERILRNFETRPGSSALAGLRNTVKLQLSYREKVRRVTQALQDLDGKFNLILQIYQVEAMASLEMKMR